jgi:hypothetical protein
MEDSKRRAAIERGPLEKTAAPKTQEGNLLQDFACGCSMNVQEANDNASTFPQ